MLNPQKELIFFVYNGRCAYCGMPLLYNCSTLDHIIPKSKCGKNSNSNLALSCYHCNQKKSDLDLEEFRELFPKRKTLFGKKKPYKFYAERNRLGVWQDETRLQILPT